MRKIILNLALSLDGYIEGPQGEYDWCFTDQDYGMTDFLGRVDALLMGRGSFEVMQRDGLGLFADKTWYVFSKSLPEVPPGVHQIRDDWEARVRTLRAQPGGDLWLFGGADLTAQFLRAGLVDELLLSIHPVLLGAGKPLFSQTHPREWFDLLAARSYETGLVQLHYQKKQRS
jgi:dihydrofolate reductase